MKPALNYWYVISRDSHPRIGDYFAACALAREIGGESRGPFPSLKGIAYIFGRELTAVERDVLGVTPLIFT